MPSKKKKKTKPLATTVRRARTPDRGSLCTWQMSILRAVAIVDVANSLESDSTRRLQVARDLVDAMPFQGKLECVGYDGSGSDSDKRAMRKLGFDPSNGQKIGT